MVTDLPRTIEVGSLAWGQNRGGSLTRYQAVMFAVRSIPELGVLLRTHARLKLRRPRGRTSVDPDTMTTPPTPLCRSAARCAQERYGDSALHRHALRTIAYAHAIAKIDRLDVDQELLWCAALLHDIGLTDPVPDECFAIRGGLLAHDLAVDAHTTTSRADLLAEAISRHPAPGLDPHTQPLAYLVNAGALLDLTGRRLESLIPASVDELLSQQTRAGLEQDLVTQWNFEATAVPHGRAHVARTLGLGIAIRCSPYPRHQK